MRADRHPGEGIPSAGRGGIPSGIAERSRGVSDSRAAGSAEGTRYCYTSLPKVEVPARFTGDQEIGTRLKAYVMHIHCEKFCWEQDGLDLRHFFRSLGNTLAGDVEAFLLERSDGEVPRRAAGPFPHADAARLREFEQLRRASRESLLAYYRRVDQLADVISCNEPRIVVAKFLDGLSRDLVGTVRDHTGVSWGGAMMADSEGDEEGGLEGRNQRGRARRAKSATPPPGEEPVCYKCREPGHFKRDCPKLQSYQEDKGELPEPFFMASGRDRDREDLGLRIGGRDGRRDMQQGHRGPRMEPSPAVQRAAEAVAEAVARAGGSHGPRMHPFERMAARPCVVEAVEGSVEVEGNYLGTTIIDMGASQVLIGRRLAEHLGLHQEENVTPEGVRIPTAERGVGKCLPRTLRLQEVVLAPGKENEARLRVHCLISDSDDYNLLLGMELL
ncbi:hypothetical protein CLOM_g13323 [Closterium sp. NIES-68]|nr:hypothetical protein CLOM_g13323 [Closterium sp. NIES-68]